MKITQSSPNSFKKSGQTTFQFLQKSKTSHHNYWKTTWRFWKTWSKDGTVVVHFWCSFGAVLIGWCSFGATCTALWCNLHLPTKTAPKLQQKNVLFRKNFCCFFKFGWYFWEKLIGSFKQTYGCFTQMMTWILTWLIFPARFFKTHHTFALKRYSNPFTCKTHIWITHNAPTSNMHK